LTARLGPESVTRLGIGLDIGTSGCRVVAIDAQRRRLAAAETPLPTPVRGAGGAVEQDPEQWWEASLTVLRDLVARLGQDAFTRPGGAALCVDATSATVLLCQEDGTPLGPALMYNDNRAREAAERIATVAEPTSAARGASSGLAKLIYLSTGHPDLAQAPALALHQADWIIGRLLGRFGDSDWNNALKLGFEADSQTWPSWVKRLVPSVVSLPRVHPPGTRLGTLSPAMAERTGLPPELLLCAGTTDSTAAVIATGAARPGDAVTSLGSTLVLKLVADRPVSAPEYGVYSQRLGQRWLVGGASNSGGAVLRQFFDDTRLRELSRSIDPDRASGLDFYPLPEAGERFPIADPTRPPRLTPRPADDANFLHGLLEGIARIERDGYRRLVELGAPSPQRVLTTGGGAANPVWSRIRQRCLGLPVTTAEHQDAAYGAALLALGGAKACEPTRSGADIPAAALGLDANRD
jgi:sugar (pentulose or hexulose) kinase